MNWVRLPHSTRGFPKKGAISKVRFLVDESLGKDAVRVLRENGWNAEFVSDLNLVGKDDGAVFATAWKTGRVILTHDRDFLDNRKFPHHRNPGIIVFVIGASGEDDQGLLAAFRHMQYLMKAFGSANMRGTKIVFSDAEHVIFERKLRCGSMHTSHYWVPKGKQAMKWTGSTSDR